MSKILIFAMAGFPQQLQSVESFASGGNGSPYPMRVCVLLLDLNSPHVSVLVGDNGVEQGWIEDREQYEINVRLMLDRGAVGVEKVMRTGTAEQRILGDRRHGVVLQPEVLEWAESGILSKGAP